jgi:hypothetical protein
MECILRNASPVESEVHHVQVFHKMKCLYADMGILFSEMLCFFIFHFFGVISIGYVLGITMKKCKKKGSIGFYTFTLGARALQK